MKPTEEERLQHIIQSIDKITSYISGMNESDFIKSDMAIDAVLYHFSVIGEAIKHINDNLLAKYPYPWHLVKSFRNYIAHEYFGINLALVWGTAKTDLPEIRKIAGKMLKKEFNPILTD